ncbi:MAG: hypothetical protein WBO46_22290 [Caldilineaceae bacterium]
MDADSWALMADPSQTAPSPPLSDLKALRQQVPDVFRAFSIKNVGRIYRYSYLRVQIRQKIEDLTADAFVRAWEVCAFLPMAGNPSAGLVAAHCLQSGRRYLSGLSSATFACSLACASFWAMREPSA